MFPNRLTSDDRFLYSIFLLTKLNVQLDCSIFVTDLARLKWHDGQFTFQNGWIYLT